MLSIHPNHLFLLLLGIVPVLLLNGSHLGLHSLHLQAAPHRPLIERPENEPNANPEDDKDPSVREAKCVMHPEEEPHNDCCKGLDNTLHEPPIRVGMLHVPSKRSK